MAVEDTSFGVGHVLLQADGLPNRALGGFGRFMIASTVEVAVLTLEQDE